MALLLPEPVNTLNDHGILNLARAIHSIPPCPQHGGCPMTLSGQWPFSPRVVFPSSFVSLPWAQVRAVPPVGTPSSSALERPARLGHAHRGPVSGVPPSLQLCKTLRLCGVGELSR